MIHKGKVQTVLGPVEPAALGITLPHEHVLIDMTQGACSADALIEVTESAKAAGAIPMAGWEPGEDGPGTAASWRTKWDEPICLSNRADIARNWFYYGDYKITRIDDVIEEAERFKRHGGGCHIVFREECPHVLRVADGGAEAERPSPTPLAPLL